MLGKVRPTTHRENGADPQPKAGLSEGRLALVHRYMVDAETAEAKARVEAEMQETRARAEEQARREAAAAEEMRRDAAELERMRLEIERRRASKLQDFPVFPLEHEQAFSDEEHPDARQEARTRKAIVREEKRAATEAARRMASLEKKEARERRALAKAAARRRAERQLPS